MENYKTEAWNDKMRHEYDIQIMILYTSQNQCIEEHSDFITKTTEKYMHDIKITENDISKQMRRPNNTEKLLEQKQKRQTNTNS